MPKKLSRLTQLKTLSYFVVGFDEGCKIEELGPLKYLKGKLSIFYFERVKSKKEAMAPRENKIIMIYVLNGVLAKKKRKTLMTMI